MRAEIFGVVRWACGDDAQLLGAKTERSERLGDNAGHGPAPRVHTEHACTQNTAAQRTRVHTESELLNDCYSRQIPRSLRRMKSTKCRVSGVGISVSIFDSASFSFRLERYKS